MNNAEKYAQSYYRKQTDEHNRSQNNEFGNSNNKFCFRCLMCEFLLHSEAMKSSPCPMACSEKNVKIGYTRSKRRRRQGAMHRTVTEGTEEVGVYGEGGGVPFLTGKQSWQNRRLGLLPRI